MFDKFKPFILTEEKPESKQGLNFPREFFILFLFYNKIERVHDKSKPSQMNNRVFFALLNQFNVLGSTMKVVLIVKIFALETASKQKEVVERENKRPNP